MVEIDENSPPLRDLLEVQVPFLQYIQKNLSIAPIVVSHVPYESCVAVGQGLAAGVADGVQRIVGSLKHHPRPGVPAYTWPWAWIKELDPEGLYNTGQENIYVRYHAGNRNINCRPGLGAKKGPNSYAILIQVRPQGISAMWWGMGLVIT